MVLKRHFADPLNLPVCPPLRSSHVIAPLPAIIWRQAFTLLALFILVLAPKSENSTLIIQYKPILPGRAQSHHSALCPAWHLDSETVSSTCLLYSPVYLLLCIYVFVQLYSMYHIVHGLCILPYQVLWVQSLNTVPSETDNSKHMNISLNQCRFRALVSSFIHCRIMPSTSQHDL